ncbi:MAG TPA: hypothetical protein VJH67_02625 [Candidatus Paceibacterota bacterium]
MKKKAVKTKEPTLREILGSINDVSDTVDSLAISAKNGFDNMVSKTEFGDFKDEINTTLFNIDNKLRTVDQRLEAIEKILGPLMRVSSLMQNEIRNLNSRVARLEHKAGIK